MSDIQILGYRKCMDVAGGVDIGIATDSRVRWGWELTIVNGRTGRPAAIAWYYEYKPADK
jgi:hypothetical protein